MRLEASCTEAIVILLSPKYLLLSPERKKREKKHNIAGGWKGWVMADEGFCFNILIILICGNRRDDVLQSHTPQGCY